MTQTEIEKLVKKQRDFFNSGETLNVSFRISALEKLRACIIKYEKKKRFGNNNISNVI